MMGESMSLFCCDCGDDKAATYYEYKGKNYCRNCLKAKLGVEKSIDV